MIDTDYNEESFFVRHCYFTGGGDPYKRLKTALKTDIDADAWASLYSVVSRPFPKPSTGKIAVKVINDWGDEVMKVFEVFETHREGGRCDELHRRAGRGDLMLGGTAPDNCMRWLG
jgi:hypothetical protein